MGPRKSPSLVPSSAQKRDPGPIPASVETRVPQAAPEAKVRPGAPPLSCATLLQPRGRLRRGPAALRLLCSLEKSGHAFWRTPADENLRLRVPRSISLISIFWNFQLLQGTENRLSFGAPLEDLKTKECEAGRDSQEREGQAGPRPTEEEAVGKPRPGSWAPPQRLPAVGLGTAAPRSGRPRPLQIRPSPLGGRCRAAGPALVPAVSFPGSHGGMSWVRLVSK